MSTYHPFDKTAVNACIQSADITLSNTLKAQEKVLVGFKPPEISSLLNNYVVLTGNGTWTPPESAETILAVLIGGGNGGQGGKHGTQATTVSGSGPVGSFAYEYYVNPGQRGYGGEAGNPGSGGKVFQIQIDLSGNQSFNYSCGIGGEGGASGGSYGNYGTDTTFGNYSSAEGSSGDGFFEVISNTLYAENGEAGRRGGDGSYFEVHNGDVSVIHGGSVISNAYSEHMSIWHSGSSFPQIDKYPIIGGGVGENSGAVTGSAGGGAAVGSDGSPGVTKGYLSMGSAPYYAICANGGNGANASAPSRASAYGKGGTGGNGGGGGGQAGLGSIAVWRSHTNDSFPSASIEIGSSGSGGNGSKGGDGADGCIIVYWYSKIVSKSVQLLDKNGKHFLEKFTRRFIV